MSSNFALPKHEAHVHFLRKYAYIWRFATARQEQDYADFVKPGNVVALRMVSFITVFGMSVFLMVDLFRNVDYSIVFAARSVALLVGIGLMVQSFSSNLTAQALPLYVVILSLTNFGVSLTTATFAHMPSFYLTNLVFLLVVLVSTASGLNFRHAFYLNTCIVVIFLFYSQFIKTDPFYNSQYPHIITIFIYIHLVGLVLESRRRLNFINMTELVAQKKLVEELNQQKNKIISILSHDVASPLNSLSGLLNLQARGVMKTEEITPLLSEVSGRLEDVSSMLHGLVRWSKSQIEGFTADRKPLDLIALIRQTLKLFEPAIVDKRITIEFQHPDQSVVMGDFDMITLILRNLTSNAIKFSPAGTSIRIGIRPTADGEVLCISNEGNALPRELKEKLFTYQIGSTDGTAGEKGTGLGLAMSSYFVRLNGGKIYLNESKKDQITFCVEFPAVTI